VHQSDPELGPFQPHVLGEYATQTRCQAVAAALTEYWQHLEHEANADQQPAPQDGELRMVTTLTCG
jgi:hypothetical protein